MGLNDVVAAVAEHQASYVTVTGGEPLTQPACLPLLSKLCDLGYQVSIETGGMLDIGTMDARVVRVMDVKTPGSGESHRNLWGNVRHLRHSDQVKFVICDRADYDWAKRILAMHALDDRCPVLFSPSWRELKAERLAEWILEDHLPVRLQLQLHKLLWGEERGR